MSTTHALNKTLDIKLRSSLWGIQGKTLGLGTAAHLSSWKRKQSM